ncbi:uncharacterized protein JCM10292_000820 [Rhodotorula paludigena]|uniref:uncharacterized protein n=1 Tax=Rhodotorula paludigena TaxID=86838 RepID=UPI003173BBA9
MPPFGVSAAFWRGGTSRGLVFRAEALARYAPAVRDHIILAAMGSPDPDGRQISGLGGGVSSLSKAAIVSVPGEAVTEQKAAGALPGVSWADDGERNGQKWDIVYRFAQVGVKKAELDWSASCGNMTAAAAVTAISTPLIPYTTLFDRARCLPRPPFGEPLLFPLSILSASNGVLMRARVPIDPYSLQLWEPAPGEGAEIAGVPGRDEPGIEIEMPLDGGEGSANGGLVTGRAEDIVQLDDGSEVAVSILTSGLPNIFIPLSSLSQQSFPPDLLTLPGTDLTAHPVLPSLLERIRTSAAQQFSIPLSLASPKVTLVSALPAAGYRTSSGTRVEAGDADLLVRAVSSGDMHASIPGTTLGALNIGAGTPGTVVHDLVVPSDGARGRGTNDGDVTVRAAHAAGVTESTVRFEKGTARSVVMIRTAREIMRGEVQVPERVLYGQ